MDEEFKRSFVSNLKKGIIFPVILSVLILLISKSNDLPVNDLILRCAIILICCFGVYVVLCFVLAKMGKEFKFKKIKRVKSVKVSKPIKPIKPIKAVKPLKVSKPIKLPKLPKVSMPKFSAIKAKKENVIQKVEQPVVKEVKEEIKEEIVIHENTEKEPEIKEEIILESIKEPEIEEIVDKENVIQNDVPEIKEENITQNVIQNIETAVIKEDKIKEEIVIHNVIQNVSQVVIQKEELSLEKPKEKTPVKNVKQNVSQNVKQKSTVDFVRTAQKKLDLLKRKMPVFSESSKPKFDVGRTRMDFDSDNPNSDKLVKLPKVDVSTDIDDCRLFEIARKPENISEHELTLITTNPEIKKRYDTFLKNLSDNFDKNKEFYYLKKL